MRNLKKVLSLVLCLAMMLSIMVVGAGAAFGDQGKIENAEAVEMCTALGIIDGFEDGNYHPEKNITRAQAAKLICVMLNGGKDAVKDAAASSFTDVLTDSTSAWANKYIEFCSAEGIVAGVGGNRFAPASNVTGTQLAKMLLVALGYNAAKEGFTGDSWALNVNTKAVKAGLYKGLEDVDMSVALSRDDAAQMIWNALNADTVVYWTSSVGALTYGEPLLQSVFGASVVTGIMEGGVDYNYDTGVYTYVIGNGYYESEADYGDLFAMNVKALVKGDDVLAMMVNKGGVVDEGVLGDFDPSDYNFDNTPSFNPTVNVVEFNRYDTFGPCSYRAQDCELPFNLAPYYGYRAIDIDGGGDIDTIVVYPYTVLKVTDVDASQFTVRALNSSDGKLVASNITTLGLTGTIKNKNVEVIGDLERYGYAVAIPAQNTLKHLNTYIDLDAQTGTPTNLNTRDQKVTMNGSEYKGELLLPYSEFVDISLKQSYTYVEVNGYLFVMDGAGVQAPTNYAVVTDVALNSTGTTAKVYETELLLTTGETITVQATSQRADGTMVTFVVNNDGNYVLTPVKDGKLVDNNSIYDNQEVYKEGAVLNAANHGWPTLANGTTDRYGSDAAGDYFLTKTEGAGKYYIEDDAVIFVYYAADKTYDVLTGAELEDAEVDASWAFTGASEKSNGFTTVDLGYVEIAHDIDEVTHDAYILGVADRQAEQDANGDFYVTVEVLLPGGEVTTMESKHVETEDDALLQALYAVQEDGIYQITVLGDKVVHVGDQVSVTEVTVDATYDSTGKFFKATNDVTYVITKDTKIYSLDGKALTDITAGDLVYIDAAAASADAGSVVKLATLVYDD